MLQRTLIIVLAAIFCLTHVKLSSSARILGIFPIVSRSHHSMNQVVLRSLASKGHEVTTLSHFITEKSLANYTEILIGEGKSFIDSITIDEAYKFAPGISSTIYNHKEVVQVACIQILSHEYVQNLINLKSKAVDIIITEQYHSLCMNLLAYKLEVPIIAMIAPYTSNGVDFAIGNPSSPSYLPTLVTKNTNNMNFMQRMVNSMRYLLYYTLYYWYFNNNLEKAANKYLNITVPSIEILHKKASLALYNNHFSLFKRPTAPNAINVAGIHIKNSKPLPKDIQKFIEESEHGVIYFSFGTTMKASSIHPEKFKIIKEVFSLIPQRVLWRVDDLNLTKWNFSPNVKLSSWFPQRDILEYENVRAFISHCGIFGTIEAIYTGTPVIVIPFVFDQFQNGKLLEEYSAAVSLDYNSLTRDNFYDAINKIINDTKYKENMKKLSKIFKDRPLSPLDEAIYWIEYVIRHNGAPHLRLSSADMPFYIYFLLDVILFILIISFMVVFLIVTLVRKIRLRCNKSKNNKYKIQ